MERGVKGSVSAGGWSTTTGGLATMGSGVRLWRRLMERSAHGAQGAAGGEGDAQFMCLTLYASSGRGFVRSHTQHSTQHPPLSVRTHAQWSGAPSTRPPHTHSSRPSSCSCMASQRGNAPYERLTALHTHSPSLPPHHLLPLTAAAPALPSSSPPGRTWPLPHSSPLRYLPAATATSWTLAASRRTTSPTRPPCCPRLRQGRKWCQRGAAVEDDEGRAPADEEEVAGG